MKIIIYYLLLLVFVAILAGFLLQYRTAAMSMQQMVSVSVLLGLYVVGMSLVGEGKIVDERDMHHRYLANRFALLAGTIALSVGVLYQVFTHKLDLWLLAALIVMNLVKIITLMYANYKR
jgi:hypothetical protein